MGSMSMQQRQIVWFLAIYGLSLGTFALFGIVVRLLVKWAS
jgi:hypothetical protein